MKKRKLLISAILMAASLFMSVPAYAAIDDCVSTHTLISMIRTMR